VKGVLQLSKGTVVESTFNFSLLHDAFNHVVIVSTSENSTILNDSTLKIEKIKKPMLGAFNAYQRGRDGSLWLATRQGLKHYNHRYHLVEIFNSDNGLNNDVIYEIRFNRDSSLLFASTNRGISSIDVKTKIIVNYSTQDGVQESEHNTGASAIGKDGTFFFGNISGVTFFKQENLKGFTYKPLIFVTNILVNDSDYKKPRLPQFVDTIVLQPGTNNFSLRYRVFQSAEPEKIIYSYKLEGEDRSWEKNNSSPTINYTGLEPGYYTLKLRGRVENQFAEKIIIIHVLPPFYKTWWFRLIACIAALLVIFVLSSLIAKARVRRKEKKLETERRLLEQKTQISRDLHDNVGARLSMMLNTMDWITKTKTLDAAVINELQDNTKSVIQNLRETIWVMNKEEVTVVELFDKIKTYALQFFKHYGTQVHFDEHITNDKAINSEQTLNLFRITQEVLNNILKYASASLVNIGVHYQAENSLEINFKDNGVGFDLSHYQAGNGILNMKERADEINAEFHIESQPGKGTFIRIRLYSK
jgi:signal transduction histidine kinase